MSTDTKPKLTIDDLLQEATKLVRDKIPDGLPGTVQILSCESLLTDCLGGAKRASTHIIDIRIDGQDLSFQRNHEKLADAITHAHKAIEKFVSDREAARVERERAEFDAANVGDRFESSGIA